MQKLEAYHKSLPYSYALGIYPAMCLIESRPEAACRLLLKSGSEDREGILRLRGAFSELGLREEFADRVLGRISGKENCYAAAVFDKYDCALNPARPHVVLHQVSDAGNLGTILRTCAGFRIQDLAVIRPAVDIFDPRVVRATMGAFFQMNVRAYDSIEDYRADFPEHGLYPFMLGGAIPLHKAAPLRPELYTLLFGNEQTGLPASFESLGTPVFIPQSSAIDSLNLAAAAAIGIYAFTKEAQL